MSLMSYKTEINPTKEQIQVINRTIGVGRYVYNFYIQYNNQIYSLEKKFVSGTDFSKWLNNEFIPNNPDYFWIKEVSSKSTKQSIMNADRAFRRFFKGESGFPSLKKKGKSDVKMYFVKTDSSVIIPCERHRIKVPTLGWVQLKEKGYIPTNKIIKSGTISCHAGRYYISALIEEKEKENEKTILNDFGIGIDLGIKDFAICSNGIIKKNINKTLEIKKLEKKLKKEQRSFSKKYTDYYNRISIEEGDVTKQNIQKQKLKIQRIHQKINNIHNDYINKCICEIVKTKPSYITIEDLNVKGMMKNRHLSKAIAQQGFNSFTIKLILKAHQNNIEIRKVNRWYPSSKMCNACGYIKSDLKLSDRVYICECGHVEDRDLNAAMNLRDATEYTIA